MNNYSFRHWVLTINLIWVVQVAFACAKFSDANLSESNSRRANAVVTPSTVVLQDSVKELQYDDRSMTVRTYSENLSDQYTGESFDYSERNFSERKLVTGILSDILSAIADFFGFELPYWVAMLVKYLFYAALGGGAIYFLLKTFRSGRSESLLAKTASKIKATVSSGDAPQQINYRQKISELEASGDYRRAVRYYYLWMLRTLEDKGTIEWHQEKTNAEYLQEIADNEEREAFQQASFIYDHIWYGEFPVDQPLYERARKRFGNFLNVTAT